MHSKRDSAYSSFSTNPSIPECTASPFSKEHSSADRVHSRGSQLEGMRQADIRYVKTVYDAQRRISEEYEVKSSALLPSSEGQASLDGCDHGRLHNSSRNDTAPSYSQPGKPLLPTGVYPVPSPEPHYAQVPQPSASNHGTLFPALAKESGYSPSFSISYDKGAASSTLGFEENGNQSTTNGSGIIYEPSDAEKEHDGTAELVQQKTPNTAGLEVYLSMLRKEELPSYEVAHSNQDAVSPAQASKHSFLAPQTQLRDDGERKAPYQPSEDQEAESQAEKHGDLQNIPESSGRQSSSESCEGYSGAKLPYLSDSSKEERDHRGQWSDADPQVFVKQDEDKSMAPFHAIETKYEETPSQNPKTSDPGRSRLSSCSTQVVLFGKPNPSRSCRSVLEKV
ncbi:hypothetical protein ASZ78_004227, partial [Callipepla squamata]